MGGELLEALNGVVGALRQVHLARDQDFQFADWAALAEVIATAVDGPEIDRLLAGVRFQQAAFALWGDPVWAALTRWLFNPANQGRWVMAQDLNAQLAVEASRAGTSWACSGARALSQRLLTIWDVLQRALVAEKVVKHGGYLWYRFAFRFALQVTMVGVP